MTGAADQKKFDEYRSGRYNKEKKKIEKKKDMDLIYGRSIKIPFLIFGAFSPIAIALSESSYFFFSENLTPALILSALSSALASLGAFFNFEDEHKKSQLIFNQLSNLETEYDLGIGAFMGASDIDRNKHFVQKAEKLFMSFYKTNAADAISDSVSYGQALNAGPGSPL